MNSKHIGLRATAGVLLKPSKKMAEAEIAVRSPGEPRLKRKAMTSEEKKQHMVAKRVASKAAIDAADASKPAEKIGLWFYETSASLCCFKDGLPFFLCHLCHKSTADFPTSLPPVPYILLLHTNQSLSCACVCVCICV